MRSLSQDARLNYDKKYVALPPWSRCELASYSQIRARSGPVGFGRSRSPVVPVAIGFVFANPCGAWAGWLLAGRGCRLTAGAIGFVFANRRGPFVCRPWPAVVSPWSRSRLASYSQIRAVPGLIGFWLAGAAWCFRSRLGSGAPAAGRGGGIASRDYPIADTLRVVDGWCLDSIVKDQFRATDDG